jgi:3-hydroxyisobutyrate dehydrogenase-like beta-hydroxyacid dehydrogenase
MVLPRVGCIGLGAIGVPIAERLLAAGFSLTLHDVVPSAVAALVAKGARAAASPAAVAAAAEIVVASLPTSEICREVALGPAGIINGGAVKVYVETSTAGAATIEAIAERLSERGILFLDAPVSGGAAGVRSGHLAVMAAGAGAAVDQARPVLDALTDRLFVVGDRPGQGQIVKLANQLLNITNITVACEALAMTTKAGLDPALVLAVVNAGSGRNSATESLMADQMLTRAFSGGARLDIMHKDIALAVAETDRLKAASLVGSSVRQVWTLASNEDGNQDFTNIYRYFEHWAGIKNTAVAQPTPAKRA